MHAMIVSAVRMQLCVAVIISIIAVQVTARDEDFEGNVRLMFDASYKFEGVLQVFTQNNWNTVCYKYNGELVTNRGAASAACRQRGYTTAAKWDTAESLHYNNTKNLQPKAITGIRCPDVKFALGEDEIFLLRCDYDVELVDREECDGVVGVQCDNTKQHDTAYNGKVNRIDDHERTELLGITFQGEQLPICTSYLSKTSADSACRQMGFTQSDSTIPQPHDQNNGKSWKIHDLSECDNANTSLPCFTDCIDRSLGYTLVDQCDENQYELICQFDKNTDGVFSAGDQFICVYPSASTDVPLDVVIGVSLLLSAIIVVLAILLLCLCCCSLPIDNRAADQPFRLCVVLWGRCRRNNPERQPLAR